MNPKKILPIAAVLFAQTVTSQSVELPIPVPADRDTWIGQHIEHRWLRFVGATRSAEAMKAGARAHWVQELGKLGDGELLTWVALYDNDARVGEDLRALSQLVAMDDPRWPAVALWTARGAKAGQADRVASQQGFGSHGQEGIGPILQPRVADFAAWLQRHAPTDPDGQWLGTQMLMPSRIEDPHPKGLDRFAPPFRPELVILRWLDVPAEVDVLSLDAEVDDRIRYRHQVLRAIRGLGSAAMRDPNYFRKASSLTSHADEEVRRQAFRMFARTDPAFVPWRRFVVIAEDPDRSDDDRRRAVFALSHAAHPGAYWWMVDRCFSLEATPYDEMLVVRLGETDHGYAELRLLVDSLRDSTQPTSRFAGVQNRLASSRNVQAPTFRAATAEACAARLAWARLTGREDADDFLETTARWLSLPGVAGSAAEAAALFEALDSWLPREGTYPMPRQVSDGLPDATRMAAAVRKAAAEFAAALRD